MRAVAVESAAHQSHAHRHQTDAQASVRAQQSTLPVAGIMIQRKAGCACGGGCPRCRGDEVSSPHIDGVGMGDVSPLHGDGPRRGDVSSPMLQTKLTVNTPGDAHEQEADRVADQVMRMPDHSGTDAPPSQGDGASFPASAQTHGATPGLQRDTDGEEDETAAEPPDIQAKEIAISRMEASSSDHDEREAPPEVHQVLGSAGEPLSSGVRGFMESGVGYDFSQVRVHTDARAAESARAVNALAYTVGNNVVFGAGQYAPNTNSGKRLIAHELTHVAQQGAAVRRSASANRVAMRRTASSVQRRATPAPSSPVCGPNVTQQFRGALGNIETTFRHWRRPTQLRACQRILVPITPDLQPDINGWDTIPLFQGASRWLRTPPVYSARRHGPCATPSSSDPSNRDNFAAGHEDPNTCSNSVQFENGCWLNGSVNYATFGVMVRLCEGSFSFAEVVRSGSRGIVGDDDVSDVLGAIAGLTGMSLIDWAVTLIRAYKAARGSATDSADLPISWVRAFYNGGSSAAPPGGANRSRCATTCRQTGARQRWRWVWEPVQRR